MEKLTDEELELINTKPRYLAEDQKRERLRIKNRLAKRRQRERMTEEERQKINEARREHERIAKRIARANETPEQAEKRKKRNREHMRLVRQQNKNKQKKDGTK